MFAFVCAENESLLQYCWTDDEYARVHGLYSFPVNHWKRRKAAFYQNMHDFSTLAFPESVSGGSFSPLLFFHGRLSIIAWARLDNRDELFERLGLFVEEERIVSDVELLCRCYLEWKQECVDYLVGDFSFVIYDDAEQVVFGARDHFGVRPLYYVQTSNDICCAASLRPLLDIYKRAGRRCEINRQWLCDFLCDHGMHFTQTAVEGFHKLAPGHCFVYKSGSFTLWKYYTLTLQQPKSISSREEAVEIFRDKLHDVVRCRLGGGRATGVELSGGLDSSGISGFIAKECGQEGKPVHCFGFSQFEKDVEYMRAQLEAVNVNCKDGPQLHLYEWAELNKGSRKNAMFAGKVLGHPVEHESSSFVLPIFEDAQKHGVGCLLSGFGGDEFVTNIQHHLIVKYLISQRQFGKLMECFAGNWQQRMKRLVRAVGGQIIHQIRQQRDGFHATLYKSFLQYWPYYLVTESLQESYEIRKRYFARTDFDNGYCNLHKFLVEKRVQPFIGARMANCSLLAAHYGIEYRWPLLDKRLIELYLSMPQELNLRNGLDRCLYRDCVKPYVHQKIYTNKGKKMGRPVVEEKDYYIREPGIEYSSLHPALQEIVDEKKYRTQLASFDDPSADEMSKYFYAQNIKKLKLLTNFLEASF